MTAGNVLSEVRMCRTAAEIVGSVGDDPALVLVDAPLAVPEVRGRRDAEHVLAWLDVAAFPVTPARMQAVHGGAPGVDLAAALAARGHVVAEALPDQVLRQAMWEQQHPPDDPPLDMGAYRAAWLGVRPPPFRPRGGRARHDGLAPARALLEPRADLSAWPRSGRSGDLAALDEAAVIDAVACATLARRCLDAPGDRWAVIGDARAGRVVLSACPELIARARTHIERLRTEGTITISATIAGTDLGPPPLW